MKHQTVKSSNIKSVGHDNKTKTMEVTFHNNKTYSYTPVTSEGYKKFVNAPSIGSFFFKNFKNNKSIDCKEVTGKE